MQCFDAREIICLHLAPDIILRDTDYGMSDIETDSGSVHEDEDQINNLQEDSGSEYQGEDDDHSDDAANSVRSGRTETSNQSRKSGSPKKSKPKANPQSPITKNSKVTYSDAYRDFYNAEVEELIHPYHSITQGLPASEIGVAVWTPLEKEILYQKVSALGKDDIKRISSAIRTKSETEVRQYLSLLDQGTVEGNVTKSLPVFSAADVSPAFEVSKQSEELLEEYANGLARYQTRSDQKREKKRHGDYWLLTEEIAQEVEEQVMARDASYMKSGLHDEVEDDGEDDDLENAKSDLKAANTDVESEQEEPKTDVEDEPDSRGEATAQNQEPGQQSSESLEDIVVPSAELLDLPMWLRLSRLFMYQSSELGDSWDNIITSGHETPSIYHTAFQDFHNLTVSLTRRVVQATIFQTMTRLRARDKDQPSARVTTADVRAATEILDLQPNTRKFWASVPRKHGLRLYERGSKFSRGQSRAGLELTLEEAEERLGGQKSVAAEADDDVVQTVEDDTDEDILDPDQYYNDSELWTEASDTEDETPVDIPDDQRSNASDDEEAAYHPTDDEEAQDAVRKKRHRKGRMERNFQKAHDAYLEAVDQEISRMQEVGMWDTLGVAPPNDIKNEEVEVPRQPVIKRRLSDTANWRDGFEYHSPWELGFDTVQPEAFASMHKRGEQARKRRRMAYEYLEREGLVVLPQQAPEITVVIKSVEPTHVDTDMPDAPSEETPHATTETFDDGVPRKKYPAPIHKALSRASSVRGSSHESFVSQRSVPTNLTLLNNLMKRTPAPQMEESLRRAEEERKAEETRRQVEEQVREEKRRARAARKALSEEEKLALKKERQEEKNRKAQENRRKEREKQEQEEMERLAAEEKRRVREERRMAKVEKRKADHEEAAREDANIEQQGDATRLTGSRSKKSKRKSGF